jgi:myosin heavy subunit
VRDGFAQAIYAGIFRRVVEQANASLAADFAHGGCLHAASSSLTQRLSDLGSSSRWSGATTPCELGAAAGARASHGDVAVAEPAGSFVGLRDIFGFEALGVNSLEQLCINYANEKLQDLFVSLMIERTQELYATEGVRFEAAAVPEHERGSMALLEAIFRSLTEECVLPRGSDSQMLDKLLRLHEANAFFNTPPGKLAASGNSQQRTTLQAAARRRERMVSFDTKTFVVSHFAGPVRYGVEGFLQKNRDPLSQDLQVMMQWSSMPLLARIFSVGSGTIGSKFHGVVERFLASLRALLDTMGSANVHFIR